MTLEPGQSGTLSLWVSMSAGMGGLHVFQITVKSNDPISPETVVTFTADFGP